MRWKSVVLDQTTGEDGGGGAATPSTTAPVASVPDAAPAAPVVSDAGGTSAAPAGKETQPAASEDESSLEQVFSEILSEDEAEPEVVAPAKPVAQPAARPAAPATPVQAAPVAPTPPAQPATPAAEVPPAQPAQPAQPVETDEQRQARVTEARTKILETLAGRYAVAETDVADLVTSPEKVLPKMLAQLHANVMDHMQGYIAQNFPRWVDMHQNTSRSNSEAAESFYKEWPELRAKEHGPTVVRMLTAYRQANPQAKTEEVIREGGLAALVALKLPLPSRLLGPNANNLAQPDATRAGAPPVHAGVAARAAPGTPETNPFTILATEDLADR